MAHLGRPRYNSEFISDYQRIASAAVGMPVAPAVTVRFVNTAGNAGGKTKQDERNKKATHGDPFALGITPPEEVLAADRRPFKLPSRLHWKTRYHL